MYKKNLGLHRRFSLNSGNGYGTCGPSRSKAKPKWPEIVGAVNSVVCKVHQSSQGDVSGCSSSSYSA